MYLVCTRRLVSKTGASRSRSSRGRRHAVTHDDTPELVQYTSPHATPHEVTAGRASRFAEAKVETGSHADVKDPVGLRIFRPTASHLQ